MKFSIGIVMVAILVLSAGCSHADQPAQQTRKPSSVTTAAKPQQPAAPDVVAPASPASVEPANVAAPQFLPAPHGGAGVADTSFTTVGVPACDQFARVMQQCLSSIRGETRASARFALKLRLAAWKKALASGTSAADVAAQCTSFRARWKTRFHASGCQL